MIHPSTRKPVLETLRTALTSDPKRTSLMVGLAVVMLILWGRVLLNGPASATASFIRRSVSTITDSPLPDAAPSNNAVLDWLNQPKKPIERNLFAIHLDYYARSTRSPGNHGESGDTNSLTNSSGDLTDQSGEQQVLGDNLQAQAGKLKLQSTVMGSDPRALVNGELVKEGDVVAGFSVVKIEPQKVVLQQDGVVLEIAMP